MQKQALALPEADKPRIHQQQCAVVNTGSGDIKVDSPRTLPYPARFRTEARFTLAIRILTIRQTPPELRNMDNKPKLLIFIEHNLIIRHFLLSGSLEPLRELYDCKIVIPRESRRVSQASMIPDSWEVIKVDVDPERAYRFRRLYQVRALKRLRSLPESDWAPYRQFWMFTLGKKAFWLTYLLSLPLFRQIHYAFSRTKAGFPKELCAFVEKEKPAALLHPCVLEGLFISDLHLIGKRLGVPTVVLMNSWDNPSTKASAVGYPDSLGVWGEQTRQHAIRFMGFPESIVETVGAAQFELYRKPPREDAASYRRKLGIEDSRKIILYAGSNKGLDEVSHLRLLEEAVESGELSDCVIVFRPHPWRMYPEGEADFFSIEWKHVVMDPTAKECYVQRQKDSRMRIDLADYEDTHVVLSSVDIIISSLSTILIEANVHGVIGCGFLPEDELEHNTWTRTNKRHIHFREYFEKMEGELCQDKNALVASCHRLLEKCTDPDLPERLRKQSEFFVEFGEASYAEKVIRLIRKHTG